MLLRFAQSEYTPGVLLGILSRHHDLAVQTAVAQNPTTPKQDLDRLRTGDNHIRIAVAENPNTAAYTLAYLHTDKLLAVRVAVAVHKSTPPYVLAALCLSDQVAVRLAAAHNTNTPQSALEGLLQDPRVSWVARNTICLKGKGKS